jgi:glycolate oxidase iron-sulfur subunit
MQTNLADFIRNTREGEEADAILRACVHCGFCTATCPTYQLLGDELDGPRGRIYLIKQVLEGAPVTTKTQQHLDRCLTCRNCETTCPSGVKQPSGRYRPQGGGAACSGLHGTHAALAGT